MDEFLTVLTEQAIPLTQTFTGINTFTSSATVSNALLVTGVISAGSPGTAVTNAGGNLLASTLTGALPVLNGSALTNLNAANLSGTLPALNGSNLTNLNTGALTGSFQPLDASALTNLNASAITAGTVRSTLLPSTVAYTSTGNTFTAPNTFNSSATVANLPAPMRA